MSAPFRRRTAVGRRTSSSFHRARVPACALSALAAVGAAGPASGQQAGVLEEIVVTAQFRAADVQDTPIAITAITSTMLEARSQTNIFEVAAQAPNVTLKPAGQAFGPSMVAFIRGIGQADFIFALEPGVGLYIDDVYHSTLTGSLLDLLDLQRVEVLRGPQGTLAGRNSIGGAIKLYSRPPGEDSGSAQVTYGSLNRVDVRASGDFTLIPDVLAARISGASRLRDGYVDVLDYGCLNPGSGVPVFRTSDGCKVDERGDQSYVSGRLFLRWTPSSDVDVDLIADVVNDSSGSAPGTLLYGHRNPPAPGGRDFCIEDADPSTPPVCYRNHVFVPYGPNRQPDHPVNDPYVSYETMSDFTQTVNGVPVSWKPVVLPSKNTLQMWGVSGQLNWRIRDDLSLTSISAFRTYDSYFNQDSDLSPIAVTLVGNRVEHEQWSQELRLNGSWGELVDWTVGGFYFDQKNFYESRVNLTYADLDFIHGPDPTPSTTWALFVHGIYHLTDRLNLSAGLRYSDEKKDYVHQRTNPDGSLIGPPPFSPNFQVGGVHNLEDNFRDDRFDWRVSLDYSLTDDLMTYASVSTGYKGGGVNPRPFFAVQAESFNPETLTAYEIGFKSALLDRRLRFNGAVFFNDYKDIQLTLNQCEIPFPPFFGAPCAKPSNVGSADVKGAELEVEFYPVPAVMVDASLSYLDFKYTEILGGALNPDPAVALTFTTPYTPEWKASGGLQYEFARTALGSFSARADASYQSAIHTNAANAPTNRIDGYTLVNARLWWDSPDDSWQASLEITNLTDKLYYLTKFDQAISVGQVTGQPGLPRQWAVTLRRNF